MWSSTPPGISDSRPSPLLPSTVCSIESSKVMKASESVSATTAVTTIVAGVTGTNAGTNVGANIGANVDKKSLLHAVLLLTFMSLPISVRIYILDFLDPESLRESTLVSKQLYLECNGPGIEVIPVFRISPIAMCVGSTQNFLQNMSDYQQDDETNRKLQRYCHMEVIDINKFNYIIGHALLQKIRKNDIRMNGIVLLNISLPYSSLQPRLCELPPSCSLAIALSGIVPNLRELNLSNTCGSSGTVLQSFSENCPWLEKITCNNNDNIYADGSEIQSATNLKEIIMDDCKFVSYLKNPIIINNTTAFLFHCWSSKVLERVSILNARYRISGGNSDELILQNAIIKYIRNGAPPSLRWFRSELSQKNMDMLQSEQPRILFLN